jgi:hypothetical protein
MRLMLVALVALAGCAGTTSSTQTSAPAAASVQYPHQLTAAEIRATMANSTEYAAGNWGLKTYATYYSANGHIHFKGPDDEDTGTFRITDDGLMCTKYDKYRKGQETCQTVWLTAPNTPETHLPDGKIVKPTAWSAGNPEGL